MSSPRVREYSAIAKKVNVPCTRTYVQQGYYVPTAPKHKTRVRCSIQLKHQTMNGKRVSGAQEIFVTARTVAEV